MYLKNPSFYISDEIFLPKEETDLHPDMDEFEREIEEFKR